MLRLILVFALIAAGAVYSLRSSFYALLFYLWIAYFRPEFWIWSDTLQGSGLSLYVGIYLLLTTLVRERRVWAGGAAVLMVLFCLQSLVSTLASPAFAYCFPYWTDFAKTIVVAYIIVLLVDSPERLRLALIVICLSLGLEGVKQGFAQLVLDPGEPNMNPIAFLGDNNGVAVGMLMLTPVALALAETASSWWARWGYRFIGVGTTLRAVFTYSRGGLLSLLTMCAIYWARSSRKVITAIAAFVVVGGLLASLPPAYWNRMATLTTDTEEMDSSAAGRLYFWQIATKMAMNNPFFGVGHNGFSQAFDQYDETLGEYGERRAVHSSWFGVLSETGFPGAALFVLIFVQSWWRCSSARKRARRAGDARLASIAGALETALVTFAVGATFLSFQYTEMLWHFFALSIALQNVCAREVVATEPAAVGAVGTWSTAGAA